MTLVMEAWNDRTAIGATMTVTLTQIHRQTSVGFSDNVLLMRRAAGLSVGIRPVSTWACDLLVLLVGIANGTISSDALAASALSSHFVLHVSGWGVLVELVVLVLVLLMLHNCTSA